MIIDEGFKSLLPPLSDQEYKGLEADILKNGCTDPLTVWGEILIDGHNRHAICTEHGLEFSTKAIDFTDRDAAEDWIDNHQLSRRNLTPGQYKGIMGRMYNRRKGTHGGDRKSSDQSDHLKSEIADTIAQEHGVSEVTVRRSGKLMESIGKLKDIQPDLEDCLYEGTAPAHSKIVAAAKVVDEDPEAARKILYPTEPVAPEHANGIPEKGLDLAQKAINNLSRISQDDKFRSRGFEIVIQWIKSNK